MRRIINKILMSLSEDSFADRANEQNAIYEKL